MSITDELREYADRLSDEAARKSEHGFSPVAMKLEGIADRIDAEHERMFRSLTVDAEPMTDESMAEHGWVRLPLDADGVPIRAGDVLTDGECMFVVDELAAFGDGSWSIRNEDGIAWAACDVTHHHELTVEDVLREFADEVKRCCDTQDTIAEYAAKLRLAGDDE